MSTETAKIEKLYCWVIIKYLCLKGFTDKQIYKDMLSTLVEKCPSQTAENGLLASKEINLKLNIDRRKERPVSVSSPVNIYAAHQMTLLLRQSGLRQISASLNIWYESIHTIVHVELNMRKNLFKRIPKMS